MPFNSLKKSLSFISIIALIFGQTPAPTLILAQEATPSAEATSPGPVWQMVDGVVLGQTYRAPQNDKVTITFTKLPENPGTITVKEHEVPPTVDNAGSKDYEITSNMPNGSFSFDLTLPTNDPNKKVLNSLDGQNYNPVSNETVASSDTITIKGITHLTHFIVADETAAYSHVVINEFFVNGTSEWIELYNPTNEEIDIDLDGWVLDDNGESPTTYTFGTDPGLTTISAKGFLVVFDNFGLDDASPFNTVRLINPSGEVEVIDSHQYTFDPGTSSIGRTADGGPNWTTFSTPTPGASNGTTLDTLYVDNVWNSPDNDGGHTWGFDAFASIQDAINFAPNGSTINIAARTYDNEALTINKDVTLLGSGSTTILSADGDTAISITAGNVSISNMKIANSDIGLNVSGGDVNIHNSEIYDNDSSAINAEEGVTVNATNNWWGTAVLATIQSNISGNLSYTPYYVNSAKTILSTTMPATVYIDNGYSEGNAGTHIFGYDAFATIQEGVNAASVGGTVNVAAGTYDQTVTIGKNLTVTGAGNTTVVKRTAGTAVTVTTGTVSLSQIKFSGSNTAINVTGGNATVSNSEISGNTNGITAGSGVNVAASNNFWGASSGPTHSTNSEGSGDSVGNGVAYRSFYTDSARTTLSTATIAPSNLSSLLTTGGFSVPSGSTNTSTAQVNVNEALTINVSVTGGTHAISLPSGTIITKTDGTNLDATALTSSDVTLSSLSGFDSNSVIDGALQWGVPDVGLTFSAAITLSIYVGTALNGQTLNVVRSTSTVSGWTSDGIVNPATCLVTAGICTFQATKASYYATTRTAATSSTSTSSTSTAQALSPAGGSGTPPVCSDAKPGSAPTLVSATGGINSVILNWSKAEDPLTYYLATYGLAPGQQQYGNPNIGGSGTTSYTVQGLSGGVYYYFRVRAGNGCMPGDFSNELSAVPTGEFIESPAQGFAPGVLGEATESSQVSLTTQLQQSGQSPFNAKVVLVIVVALLLGFGVLKLIIK